MSGIPAGVVPVVLIAALLHATWNALAHSARDRIVAIALMAVATGACATAGALAVSAPARASWPFIAVSSALETCYAFGLVVAYRLGQFSRMYPLARGSSPVVVALLGTVVAHESVSLPEMCGILLVTGSLLTLAFAGGFPRGRELPALFAAVGTGVVIAVCAVVDGMGVRRADGVIGYAAYKYLFQSIAIVTVALVVRHRELRTATRAQWRSGLLGGAFSILAYGLILWAQTRGSLAAVATLRETSILFSCAIGVLVLREPFGRRQALAAAGIFGGLILIANS